jgi:hypothetical protein
VRRFALNSRRFFSRILQFLFESKADSKAGIETPEPSTEDSTGNSAET